MEVLINNTLDGFVTIFIFDLFFLHPTSTVALATSNNKFASFHQLVQHSLNFFQQHFTHSLSPDSNRSAFPNSCRFIKSDAICNQLIFHQPHHLPILKKPILVEMGVGRNWREAH